MRKTIELEKVKNLANKYLSGDNSLTPDQRKAIHSFTAQLLHSVNAYKGFNYVEWVNGGCEKWRKDRDRLNKPDLNNKPYVGDETKTVFY